MPEIPKLNGKNWLAKGLLQVLIIIALVAYIAVDKIGAKASPVDSLFRDMSTTVNINSGRILRLETLMETLRSLPTDMASVKTSTEAVKQTVDKIEKKLDTHIDKGK